jgi:hypothetical protein
MGVTATDADDQKKNMKKLMTVAFAVAMLASASAAASASDQWAEERLKVKTGRYFPREESRRAQLARTAKHAPEECQAAACCRDHSSSRHQNSAMGATATSEFLKAKLGRDATQVASHDHNHQATANVQPSSSDAWARAKFGRDLSARSHVQKVPENSKVLAASVMCSRTSCCN